MVGLMEYSGEYKKYSELKMLLQTEYGVKRVFTTWTVLVILNMYAKFLERIGIPLPVDKTTWKHLLIKGSHADTLDILKEYILFFNRTGIIDPVKDNIDELQRRLDEDWK